MLKITNGLHERRMPLVAKLQNFCTNTHMQQTQKEQNNMVLYGFRKKLKLAKYYLYSQVAKNTHFFICCVNWHYLQQNKTIALRSIQN